MTPPRSLPFASAHGMIDRIHGHSPHLGTATTPTLSTRFSQRNILMIHVPDLADRCPAQNVNLSHFSGGKSHLRVVSFFGHQLRRRARRPSQLPPFSPGQFHVVNHRTHWDIDHWKIVSRQNVRIGSRNHLIPGTKSLRRYNITLFTVHVMQPSQACASIRIVFNGRYRSGNPILVSQGINHSIPPLVSSSTAPHGNTAVVVSAADSLLSLGQTLQRLDLGQTFSRLNGTESRSWRSWIEAFNGHNFYTPSKNSMDFCPGFNVTYAFFQLGR